MSLFFHSSVVAASYMAPSVVRIFFDYENEETRPESVRLENNQKGNVGERGGGIVQRVQNMLQ